MSNTFQTLDAEAHRLLGMGFRDLSHIERRVISQLIRRATSTQKAVVIVAKSLVAERDKDTTFGQRLADRVAAIGGSWGFIIAFGLILVLWIGGNSLMLRDLGLHPFDPYPYIFLNLILSMLAALQAPVIMMSQNRQASKDRLAAEHDYEVNLKAELEIMGLHEKLDAVRSRELADLLAQQVALLKELRDRTGSEPVPSVADGDAQGVG